MVATNAKRLSRLLLATVLATPLLAQAEVTAKAYIITDMEGRVLLEHNADAVRSIASITKLITSQSASAQDMTELIEVTADDVEKGRMRTTPLRAGQRYTREQLMNLSLVSSDNVAAIALGRTMPKPLGTNITWVEGSGLDPANVASARVLATLAREMIDTDISRASVQPTYAINKHVRKSTNPLIGRRGWDFALSKTGFINEAGGCLVSVFVDGTGRKLVAVLLGSRNVPERWRDLYSLRKEVDPSSSFASPGGDQEVVTKSRVRYKSLVYKKRRMR